jgi:hypothetical protein
MKYLVILILVIAIDSTKINNTKEVLKKTDSTTCTFTNNAQYFKIIRDLKQDSLKLKKVE